jgi:hypothetical protein
MKNPSIDDSLPSVPNLFRRRRTGMMQRPAFWSKKDAAGRLRRGWAIRSPLSWRAEKVGAGQPKELPKVVIVWAKPR